MRQGNDNYFHFTRKERNGILFLTALAIISVTASIVHPYIFRREAGSPNVYADDIATLKARPGDTASTYDRYITKFKSRKPDFKNDYNSVRGELFYFDPNLITAHDWKRLGLRDKTIAIIQNYLAKGGRFKEATDIKKIWGLHQELANRIIPYVRITETPGRQSHKDRPFVKNYIAKNYIAIDINSSDTSDLIRLPGIGNKLSQRIIRYRERLGGFYAVEQVAETFGLPDSTFRKIKGWLNIDKATIKKININSATLEELKAHPYIRYHLANALVQYRQQHKGYTTVEQIRNIMLIDDTTYNKVAPYLVVD